MSRTTHAARSHSVYRVNGFRVLNKLLEPYRSTLRLLARDRFAGGSDADLKPAGFSIDSNIDVYCASIFA